MKYLFLALMSASLILTSCDKDVHKMEVVKNCTGTYLKSKSGEHFLVCNDVLLESISAGTKIKVEYDVLSECFGLIEEPTCEMLFTYTSPIEITEIVD